MWRVSRGSYGIAGYANWACVKVGDGDNFDVCKNESPFYNWACVKVGDGDNFNV